MWLSELEKGMTVWFYGQALHSQPFYPQRHRVDKATVLAWTADKVQLELEDGTKIIRHIDHISARPLEEVKQHGVQD